MSSCNVHEQLSTDHSLFCLYTRYMFAVVTVVVVVVVKDICCLLVLACPVFALTSFLVVLQQAFYQQDLDYKYKAIHCECRYMGILLMLDQWVQQGLSTPPFDWLFAADLIQSFY